MENNVRPISSFAENVRKTLAQQANELSLLTAMQKSMTTNDSFVTYTHQDAQGTDAQYQLPSYATIVNRLKALEESINSLTTGKGSISLKDGSRRTVKLSTIPQTPGMINGLADPSTFKIDTNWFFEDLMFPGVTVDIDLTDQIEDDADRVKVVRIILNSNDQSSQNIWNSNLSQNTYDYLSLLTLLSNNNISYSQDEEIIELPLVYNTKAGTFQIIEDPQSINGNIWYKFDSLNYSTLDAEGIDQGRNNILSIGDQLAYSDTIFEVSDIDQNSNRVRLSKICGAGMPGVYSTFTYYQDPFRNKTISVRFGANEYNIIYVKGIAEAYNLQADNWSTPIKFASDELYFESDNGITTLQFNEYYANYIVDWGAQMIEEAKEHSVSAWKGHTPNAPTLNADDLRVVQINTQINAAIDNTAVKNSIAQIAAVKTEIDSLKQTIAGLKSELQSITNVTDYNAKQQEIKTNTLDLQNLQVDYSSKVAAFQTEVRSNGALVTDPKYHIRGFFPIPEYKYRDAANTDPEEIIGFETAYRYIKEDNTPVQLNTFTYTDGENGSTVTGTFSDWTLVQSQLKSKVVDQNLNRYVWKAENVADGTEVNINQVDIPIQKGERVELKVRSISEAGYPTNPLKSEWSNSVIISFPDNLSSTNEISDLIKDINDDALVISINNQLDSVGATAHLDDTIPNTNSVNGLYFKHLAKNIAYENTDINSGTSVVTSISVQEKLDDIMNTFNSVCFLGDLSNINYINYDISVEEDD